MNTTPMRSYWKASSNGIKALADLATDRYPGSNEQSERRSFVVANLDTTSTIYVTTDNGVILFPVRKNETITFENGQAIKVYNNSGAAVNYTFAELYVDRGQPGIDDVDIEPGGHFQQLGGGGYTPKTALGAYLIRRFS